MLTRKRDSTPRQCPARSANRGLYNRILRENPDFHDGDKVTFYLAHEQREMGEFDTMLKTLGDLIRKYPSSPLRLDAEQILGDYFFDKADLKQAEEHYKTILDAPPLRCTTSPATRWAGSA